MTVIAHVNLARGYRGGERQTEILVRGLCGRDWRQVVVGRRGEPLAQRLRDIPGVEVREAGNNALSAARAAAGADLFHAHEGRAGQAGLISRLLYGTPYLITRRVPQEPSHRFLTRASYRRAIHIAGVSRAVVESMEAYAPGVPKSCIHSAMGHLPSDPAGAAAIRARFPGKLLAGNIGALVDKHKGQTVLIETARTLAGTHPEIVFVLVGSGRDEERMKALAGNLPNVVFEGYRDNVGDYLAAFDFLVFPSREEGLGSSVIDAMDYGLPTVASRVGGLPELVFDGETGLLVPPGDPQALREAVVRVAQDPQLRRRMGEAAKRRAAAYAPEAMIEAYDRLYRDLLAGRPGGRAP